MSNIKNTTNKELKRQLQMAIREQDAIYQESIDMVREYERMGVIGSLFTRNPYGKTKYYVFTKEKPNGVFLGEKDAALLHMHKTKAYREKLAEAADGKRKVLKKCVQLLDGAPEPDEVHRNLPKCMSEDVREYRFADEELLTSFSGSNYRTNMMAKQKSFRTIRGDEVRSKSEVMIADRLYVQGVPYKYEPRLDVHDDGKAVYPDFMVLNKRLGKVLYWEHFGMIGDHEYGNRCAAALRNYAAGGFLPGENLIVTFESADVPLDTAMVDLIIQTMLK